MSSYKPLVTVWTKELSQENSQLIKQLIGEDHLTQTDINAFKTQTEINALIDAKIDDTAYNQTSWNANTDAATKNAIRDKIITMDGLIVANQTQTEVNALIATHGSDKQIHNASFKAGIFWATYNFRNDEDGSEPEGWVSNNDADCTTTIIAIQDGHRKVLQCFDNNGAGSFEIKIEFTGQPSGTVEVWWKTSDNTNRSNFFLRSGNNNVCRTYSWETGQWRYYDGGVPTDVLAIVNNRWYHHKYVFDCATDTWDWYIDGVQYGAGIAFDAVQDTLDNVIIQSRDGHSNYINYFDAIGFSWDPAYTVGDNEGYKIRRQSASAQITPVVGHLEVWRDPDDNKTYLIYTDEDEGIRKVEMT